MNFKSSKRASIKHLFLQEGTMRAFTRIQVCLFIALAALSLLLSDAISFRGLAQAGDKKEDKKMQEIKKKDLERDKATKAKPLSEPQTVRRYTTSKKDLERDIRPGEHMTPNAKGRVPSAEKAQKAYGLEKKPKYGATIELDKGQPVKKNKAIGGEPGRGEITSTGPVAKDRIKKIFRLHDKEQ
jgi:hypothetical protein